MQALASGDHPGLVSHYSHSASYYKLTTGRDSLRHTLAGCWIGQSYPGDNTSIALDVWVRMSALADDYKGFMTINLPDNTEIATTHSSEHNVELLIFDYETLEQSIKFCQALLKKVEWDFQANPSFNEVGFRY